MNTNGKRKLQRPEEEEYSSDEECQFLFSRKIKKHKCHHFNKQFIDSDEEFVAFGYFPDTLHKVCGGVETRHEYQYMKKVFANTKYFLPNLYTNFNSCFGPLYIIKNSMMKRLMDSGMLEKIKSISKTEDQMYERIMGILAEQEGYNLVDHNIEGNLYANNSQKWDCMVSDKLEYFTKRLLKID